MTESELADHLVEMDQNRKASPMSASDLLSALGSDEDGALSVEETGLSSGEFDALDTNEDGVVSQAELEAANPDLA